MYHTGASRLLKAMMTSESRNLNADQSAKWTLTSSRYAQGYIRTMRLLGLALVTVAFAWILAANASEASSQTVADPIGPTVSDLMDKHDCWSGEAPADMKGKVPGHAVVDTGHGPARVKSQVGFDIWLEGRPGKLFGFCR